MDIVIGTGPLGLAVVRELVRKGRRVRAVNRKSRAAVPASVEVVGGDIGDPAFAREICRPAEAIYLCAKPPYHKMAAQFQPIMDGAIAAAAASGARLIYADSLYAYGPHAGPLTEDLPNAAQGPKGKTRARLAQDLIAAHEAGTVQAAIGRASDFYGPGVIQSTVGERVFGFALAGKAVSVIGNPHLPHTYTFIDDFARALITLGEREEALGQVRHVPSAETMTTWEFVALIFEALGKPVKLRVTPWWLLSLVGIFDPLVRELPEVKYQTEAPFVVDHSKYERAFGAEVTDHRQAIRRTLDWFRQRPS